MLSLKDVLKERKNDISEHLLSLYNYTVAFPKDKVIVELGTRDGNSTTSFLAAVNETGGTVYSIDINEKCGKLFPKEEKWKFINGDSMEIVKNWNIPIDVLFIDTDHTYESTLKELELWSKFLKPKSIILMHDTNTSPLCLCYSETKKSYENIGVTIALKEFIKRNPNKFSFFNYLNCNGLGVLKKLDSTEKIKIKYIVVYNSIKKFNEIFLSSKFILHEDVIAYNNIENESLTKIFNKLIKENLQKNTWFVFCHQDFILNEDLTVLLQNKDKESIYGPIGVVNDSPGCLGSIVQTDSSIIGDTLKNDVPVQTLDEMCLIINSNLFEKGLKFDESFNFHFYGADICVQAKKLGYDVVATQIKCQHKSKTNQGDIKALEYISSLNIFKNKWETTLSVRTTTTFINFRRELVAIIVLTKSIDSLNFKKCYEALKKNTTLEYKLMIIESHVNDFIFKFTENINLIRSINADYYVLINDDLYVKEEWLNELIETTKQDPKIGIVGGLFFFPNGKVQHGGGMNRFIYHKFFNMTVEEAGPELYEQRDCPFVTGALQLITKKCVDTIGFYNEAFTIEYSDVEYCFRAWTHGFRVVYQPKCQAIHEEKLSRKSIALLSDKLIMEQKLRNEYSNIYNTVLESRKAIKKK